MAKRVVPGTDAVTVQPDGALRVETLDASSGVYTDANKDLSSTPPTSGALGYWDRTGTDLSPATSGDNVDLSGRLVSNTATLSAVGPTDNQDAAGINVLFIDASGNNVTLGGFINGVAGQILHVVVNGIGVGNQVTLENAEGTGNQDIYLTTGADENLTNSYGGWTLVCDGTHWYSSEQ